MVLFACAIFPKVSPDLIVYTGVVVVVSVVADVVLSVLADVVVASAGAPANLLSIFLHFHSFRIGVQD